MSIVSEPKNCPKCGAPIPTEAPQGLCPKCLLLEISAPTDAGQSASKSIPPTREELSAAFPHLEILELIGQGGMGFVFKARQPKLDRFVALKILPQSLAADPAFAERFTREGRLLARLNHPNIVTVHDFGQAKEYFYLLMEYVDGVNLRQAMRAGRFTPDQALAVVPKICEALQFAHNEGILHRDIKPENILLDTKGRVKIADFGIAKLVAGRAELPLSRNEAAQQRRPTDDLTQTGKTLGTPNYMAPEQIEKSGEVDHRADIYSLGVVFYEMLTGELPLGRFSPPSQKSAADPRLDDVVLRALEKEPNRRTQTADEMKTQVETIVTNQPPLASRRTDSPRPNKFAAHGLMVGSWVFVLAVLLTTVVTFLLPETYDAFARVKVEKKIRPGAYDPFWLQTQFEIIQSNPILTGVVQDLKLTERWSSDRETLTLDDAVGLLRNSMLVRQSRNTSLIEIHAFSETAKEAAELANAIVRNYAAYSQDDAGRIEIVSPATPPSRPVRPNKLLNIAIGVVGGIALGALAGLATIFVLRKKLSPEMAAMPASSGSDRFWKRFAVAVALVLLALILIPVIAILLAIAVPAFQKSKDKLAARQAMPVKVFGTVVDWETGKPVVGARVADRIFQEHLSGNVLQETTTDFNGRFEIRAKFLEEHLLTISARGYETNSLGILPGDFANKTEKRYEIRLRPRERASAETWSPKFADGEKPDLGKIMDEAKDLMSKGHYEEALQRYIWNHNHAQEFGDSYRNVVRLTSALSEWEELGRRYPKARQALTEIRDDRTQEILEGRGYTEIFNEVQAINHELQNDEATLALFKTIRDTDPKLAKRCYFYAENLLIANGEYQYLMECLGDPQQRFNSLRQSLAMQRESEKRMAESYARFAEMNRQRGITNIYSPPNTSEVMRKSSEDYFVGGISRLIEILVGAEQKAEAEKIRDQALAVLNDERLQNAVADAERRVSETKARIRQKSAGSSAQKEPDASKALQETKAKLAELRLEYTDGHPLVRAQLARSRELERMAKEEPKISDLLREAKAKLAEARVEFSDEHPEIKKLKARIHELEGK